MTELKMENVLVVAAHPDDEVLGCGGTMARLTRSGASVHITILGTGLTSRGQSAPEEIASLREEARSCARTLGVEDISFFDFPDNQFDSRPLLDVIKTIEEQIDRLCPDTVITHHRADLNVDHVITHRAVMTATRPTGAGQPVSTVLTFEVPSSTEWAFDQFGPFSPNYFVDITDTIDLKAQALACYSGESRPFPHPRSAQLLRSLSQVRGSSVGLRAAEAFELVRSIA